MDAAAANDDEPYLHYFIVGISCRTTKHQIKCGAGADKIIIVLDGLLISRHNSTSGKQVPVKVARFALEPVAGKAAQLASARRVDAARRYE